MKTILKYIKFFKKHLQFAAEEQTCRANKAVELMHNNFLRKLVIIYSQFLRRGNSCCRGWINACVACAASNRF